MGQKLGLQRSAEIVLYGVRKRLFAGVPGTRGQPFGHAPIQSVNDRTHLSRGS